MKKVLAIAIVGGGSLADHIKQTARSQSVTIISHDRFDITDQSQCDNIISELSTYDVVIITAGIYNDNLWDMWLTNTVGPCYLIAKLNQVSNNQKIIAISSYGSSWPSWPGIPTSKLSYNTNKSALNIFVHGLVQQGQSSNRLTIFEPSKFKSHMSDYSGADIEDIANQIIQIVNNPNHIIHVIVKE